MTPTFVVSLFKIWVQVWLVSTKVTQSRQYSQYTNMLLYGAILDWIRILVCRNTLPKMDYE